MRTPPNYLERKCYIKKVISNDGTEIDYEMSGQGPALILVEGALCYQSFGPMTDLAKLLAPHFTVTTYDRRGRGGSRDTRPYAVEREIEDIGALIQEAGGSACLFGTSSGACLALETAIKLGKKVKKLALYEPPYQSGNGARQAWRDYRKKLDEFLASGRRGDAVVLFMQFVGMPAEQVEGMRQVPVWPMFEVVAPTLIYDAAAMGEDRSVPVKRAAKVASPALVMNGSAIPFMLDTATALAKAIPHGLQRTLEGQTHNVDLQLLAPQLAAFFTDQSTHVSKVSGGEPNQ